jgi:hypothetical protein
MKRSFISNVTLFCGFIFSILSTKCEYAQPAVSGDRFRGMWRLDKFESLDSVSNKWVDDTTFIGYTGYILYDGEGHMGVHLTPKGYKNFNSAKNIDSLNMDELKVLAKFYQSNFVYFGDYSFLNDSIIEHKRLSATEPKNWGTTLTRKFYFNKDTLILTAYEKIRGQKTRLRWVKLSE